MERSLAEVKSLSQAAKHTEESSNAETSVHLYHH